MGKYRVSAAGGFPAILYTMRKAWTSGGLFRFFVRMASKNACKTCALGMGGQKGGMVNEAGHFPEFCKKSVQAQAGDMQGIITPEFLKQTSIAQMSRLTPRELEYLGRLAYPMIAEPGDTHFRMVSWEEAFDRIARGFNSTHPDRTFFYSSGRASNEAAFLLQLMARAYGTNNVNNCSYYCHQASGVALNKIYGSGTASITLDDLHHADLAIVAGANPASNHPRLITQLVELRQRGGRVIVINPLKELGLVRFKIPSRPKSLLFGSTVCDLYLQPRVGSDIALYKALLKGLIEREHLDRDYIARYTQGWDAVEADIKASSWSDLLTACGLSHDEIEQAVRIIAHSKRGIFMWAMGLTHHAFGVDNILALSNLALSQGWLGQPGSGLLPIRGHSNVQGVGTVGVAPQLKQAFAERLSRLYNITLPEGSGMDTHGAMVASHEGNIDVAFLLGGNLFGSNPHRTWAAEALQRIPLTITVSTKLNEGHLHGRGQTALILPCLARDEEHQSTTQESMFNYVRLSDGGKPLVPGDMRSEVDIIASIAERILPKGVYDWSTLHSHQALRDAIAEVVPGLEPLKDIGQTRAEFQIANRTFHTPAFPTPDGKAHFYVTPVPDLAYQDGTFQLMTIRSEGQFNTVVYEEEDLYRGNTHRDVVMMSPVDARRLNLAEGQAVDVSTETGTMRVRVSITDIAPGSLAMYYPEANLLVPQHLDPESKTPAFKSIPAHLATV